MNREEILAVYAAGPEAVGALVEQLLANVAELRQQVQVLPLACCIGFTSAERSSSKRCLSGSAEGWARWLRSPGISGWGYGSDEGHSDQPRNRAYEEQRLFPLVPRPFERIGNEEDDHRP